MTNKKNNKEVKGTVKQAVKLPDLEQAHGQLMVERNVNTSRLDVLLGADGMGKYGTLDKGEYLNKLNSFNTAELRNHAIHAGLIPISDVSRLKKQLTVEFDKYALAFTSPTKFNTPLMSKEKQKMGLEIMSVLK